ncbi:MAG: NAD(+)/NADH kinase [Syntrophomonadaceae bacterium]|jgi:NAD+ kinase
MRILLVSNYYKEATQEVAYQTVELLTKRGIQVEVDNEQEVVLEQSNFDIIIVFGGDGTILRATRKYAICGAPVLGVNMGTVGFLSNIEVHELEHYLPRLLEHSYHLDERMILQVSVQNTDGSSHQGCCLNEMVVKSVDHQLNNINVEIDSDQVGNYRGDGLMVATPTGSTAYSLSCGGPVVDPELEVLLITPIASQILSRKPMVVGGNKVIKLSSTDRHDHVIRLDGQIEIPWELNAIVTVKKADYKLKLINLKSTSFFDHIDTRLRRSEEL